MRANNQISRKWPTRLLFAFLLALAVMLALAGCEFLVEEDPTPAPVIPGGETATVTRVIDGDTIDVRLDGETFRVRYVGIDTPERDEPCYAEATQANAEWVAGQTVTLVRDVSNRDIYGRLLRYVYVGDVFVNAELVAGGYAEAGYYPPDTAYLDYFNQLEANARRGGAGCYATGALR